ncbi:MAG TPA: alpha-amylase family glycosyl hydrolase [Candidatus Acidoferrales bacterium]|nr:alpha-amylase family glycosyl hydrolase [Candidatus Acidoferrales bacterium]
MPISNPFQHRPHPHLYEINTWAWLEELSRKFGRQISLGSVPSSEWDEIAGLGFDFVWLMGVWQRSDVSRRYFQTDSASFSAYDRALPGWKLSQIAGSPYSVRQYEPDARMGSWSDLDRAREELRSRNIGLILDFVANHTAPDHPWMSAHPEYYLRGSQQDFRKYPNAFYLVESSVAQNAEPDIFAHGRDPHFPPWRDVLQLDYFEPAARAALMGELREIARHCDGVRCDMAMLVLNDIFARTWSPLLAGRTPPAQEFWSETVAALPREFIWLAEVYWNREGEMQKLGFQFTYDKGLYDSLRSGNMADIRARLAAPVAAQSHCARFLENHDEERAAAVFGSTKIESIATLIATLPGMRFYHHGQLDGCKIHLPIPLAFAAPEAIDAQTRSFYGRILKISNEPVFHIGEWKLLDVTRAGDSTFENLVAYQWRSSDALKIVVANLSGAVSQARVHPLSGFSSALQYKLFDQLHDVAYDRAGAEIVSAGLYVRLDPFGAQVFSVTPL